MLMLQGTPQAAMVLAASNAATQEAKVRDRFEGTQAEAKALTLPLQQGQHGAWMLADVSAVAAKLDACLAALGELLSSGCTHWLQHKTCPLFWIAGTKLVPSGAPCHAWEAPFELAASSVHPHMSMDHAACASSAVVARIAAVCSCRHAKDIVSEVAALRVQLLEAQELLELLQTTQRQLSVLAGLLKAPGLSALHPQQVIAALCLT